MKLRWKLLTGGVLFALLIVSCSGAAHLQALQPVAVPVPLPPPKPVLVAAPSPQLGIDIDFYTYPGQNIAAAARTDIAYIKRLHANSVSISFPFFMSGPASARVYKGIATPSPRQLAILAVAAERAHLYVSIRPLLSEQNLGYSRTLWRPLDKARWFASYRTFLLRYAAMAQRMHIPELIVGTELSEFAKVWYWTGLDRALRRVYSGRLAYANNWAHKRRVFSGNGGPGLTETVDAYPPVPNGYTGSLTAFWRAFDAHQPPGTVETEVGIDAVVGAFSRPYVHHWLAPVLSQAVQVQWFTAACQAAASTHLGGIYFWSIGLSQRIGAGPTPANQGHWAGGQGARAISNCFAALSRKG